MAANGKPVELPVMRPATSADIEVRTNEECDTGTQLLRAISADPHATQRKWASAIQRVPSVVNRHLKTLAKRGLVEEALGRWTLTSKGRRFLDRFFVGTSPSAQTSWLET